VNAVIFRREALATRGDTQYVAYYDGGGRVMLGRRRLEADVWELQATPLTGDVRDAHNAICIAADGRGMLHVAWNHHTSPLQYCRSTPPESLDLEPAQPMIGTRELQVTYPEFHILPGGDLLFLYRDGRAGDGRSSSTV
jgi:hypothetical protein